MKFSLGIFIGIEICFVVYVLHTFKSIDKELDLISEAMTGNEEQVVMETTVSDN